MPARFAQDSPHRSACPSMDPVSRSRRARWRSPGRCFAVHTASWRSRLRSGSPGRGGGPRGSTRSTRARSHRAVATSASPGLWSPVPPGPAASRSGCRFASGASTGAPSTSRLVWSSLSAGRLHRERSCRSSPRSSYRALQRRRAVSTRLRYLRRQGVHVVLDAGFYRELGRRGGALGLVDRLTEHLAASIAPGLDGERRALVAGVVLGEDDRMSEPLRDDFRASGLYHVLAVSGQNIAYVIARDVVAGMAGRPAALGGTHRRAGRRARLHLRRRLAALGRAGRDRRLARLARLAGLAPGRSLVLPAPRRRRAPRRQPVLIARARVPAVVRGRCRHLRARPAPRAAGRGVIGFRGRWRTRPSCRQRAGS